MELSPFVPPVPEQLFTKRGKPYKLRKDGLPRKRAIWTKEQLLAHKERAKKLGQRAAAAAAERRKLRAETEAQRTLMEEAKLLGHKVTVLNRVVKEKSERLDEIRKNQLAVEIVYEPQYHQWAADQLFDQQGKRYVGMFSGIRGGKTFWGARRSWKEIYNGLSHHGLGWIVAPTYPMSVVAEREFEGAVPRALILNKRAGDRCYLIRPRTGNIPYMVEVKSAEHPDRLRGANLDWVWIDEAAMIAEEAWDILLGRVLDSKGRIWISTTPAGKGNWTYYKFFQKTLEPDSEYGAIKARTVDNKRLDPRDIEALRSVYADQFAAQELDAEFTSFSGLVYNKFDPSLHTMPLEKVLEKTKGGTWVAAVDWGFNDPFVFLWLCLSDGVWYVVDEYYVRGKTIQEHVPTLKANPLTERLLRVWGDPSRPENRIELGRTLGRIIYSAKNEIEPGIQCVASLIQNNRMVVANSCRETLNEFSKYSWLAPKDRNSKDHPADIFNHAMDAIRYGVYSEQRSYPATSLSYSPGLGTRAAWGDRTLTIPEMLNAATKESAKRERNKILKESGFPSWMV